MRRALHAEWTKLHTISSTGWLLAATVVVTVGVAAVVASGVHLPACQSGTACTADTTRLALYGTRAGQVSVALLAVLAVTGEYSTGMVHLTLTATPHRFRAFGAKSATLTLATVAAAAAATTGSVMVADRIFAARGYTASAGYRLALTDSATIRAGLGTVCYLGLMALLSVGIAAIVRDGAAAIGATLTLLFAFPMATVLVSNATWQRHLRQWSPMDAGLNIQATTDLAHLPLQPWTGLGVLAAWAATAVAAGALAFRFRDA